jgi:hypothetical protein
MKTCLLHTFRDAAWAPITVIIFYAIAARGFDAYLRYPWLVMPTHFFGGVAITYFFLAASRHAQPVLGVIAPLVGTLGDRPHLPAFKPATHEKYPPSPPD